MGVTILQQYPILENRTPLQTIEFLTKNLLTLGGVQTGQFLVDCETYSVLAQGGPIKTMHVVHNSEYPASVFSILEAANKTVSLAADSLFDLLVLKMNGAYTSKKKMKMESIGPRFEIDDFCVKLGSVHMTSNFKGILIEVEYKPCMIPAYCWELLKEFIQGFLGSSIANSPPFYLQNKMQEIYCPMDTIHQYLEHFNTYRKSALSGGVRS